MRHHFSYFITLLICTSCFSQRDTTLIENWKSYSIPTNADTLNKYNWAQDEWTVYKSNNKVHVKSKWEKSSFSDTLPFKIIPQNERERATFRGKRSILKVDDGYLVAFWRGEWGGCLFWFSPDGKERYYVSNDMIVEFIMRENRTFAIEGLAHLSMSEGGIVEIKKTNFKWQTLQYLELPSAPDAVDVDKSNNFIVITSKSLFAVDKNQKIDTLVLEGFWEGLYSNSLVVHNDVVYAGMRKGVFKFDLKTHKQEWLMRE